MAVLSGCAQQPQEQKKPNIVFIFADDMGSGDVSALNENSKIQTTNIDRIASEGVTYRCPFQFVSQYASRYSLLTGRYNWRSDLKSGVLMGYNKALISRPQDNRFRIMIRDIRRHVSVNGIWVGTGITSRQERIAWISVNR